MGLSPWDSPFSLWHRKLHGWEITQTPEMEAGHRLEPVIADWFADQHPDRRVAPVGLFANDERPWQIATPDRMHWEAYPGGFGKGDLRLLECKAAFSWEGWGEPLTAEIPIHYKCQVLWQMDVMDLDIAHVAVFSGLHFREYVVRRSERALAMMRERGRRFWESIQDGEPPELDEHPATLSVIRQMNPEIVDRIQTVPMDVVAGWRRAKRMKSLADRLGRRASARMRAHMGDAKHAACGGIVVASRSIDDKLMVAGARKGKEA